MSMTEVSTGADQGGKGVQKGGGGRRGCIGLGDVTSKANIFRGEDALGSLYRELRGPSLEVHVSAPFLIDATDFCFSNAA